MKIGRLLFLILTITICLSAQRVCLAQNEAPNSSEPSNNENLLTGDDNENVNDSVVEDNVDGEKLTPEEMVELENFIKRFEKRLAETRDLSPLIKEFFVSEFAERLYKTGNDDFSSSNNISPEWSLLLLSPSLIHQIVQDELLNFYNQTFNMHYINILYCLTKISIEQTESEITNKMLFPPGVIKILKTDPYLAESLKDNGDSKVIEDLNDFRNATKTLEKAVKVAQARITETEPEKSELFQKNLDYIKNRMKITPKHYTCEGNCLDLAEGTIFVEASLSLPFRLSLIKVDGQFKILYMSIIAE